MTVKPLHECFLVDVVFLGSIYNFDIYKYCNYKNSWWVVGPMGDKSFFIEKSDLEMDWGVKHVNEMARAAYEFLFSDPSISPNSV